MKGVVWLAVLVVVAGSSVWGQSIETEGNIETDGQLVSKVAPGRPPLLVSSSTRVRSLNADQVDGMEASAFAQETDLQSVEAMLAALQLQVDALGLALVPRTGQTTCYDAAGGVVTCGTGIGLAQDGDLQLGVNWPNPRFTINESSPGVSDGTVTDNLTGLIWLQDADCFGLKTWAEALTAANGLFDGSTNDPGGGDCGLLDNSAEGAWRLPNVRELQSLVHYGVVGPAVPDTSGTGQWSDGDPFSDVQSASYWSSTTNANNTGSAWDVNMNNAVVASFGLKANDLRVWPVRGGQ